MIEDRMIIKGLFSKDDAATYLSTSSRRIDELRRAGDLGAVADGREWKFNREALDEYRLALKPFEPGRLAS